MFWSTESGLTELVNLTLVMANTQGSQSPIRLMLRLLDKFEIQADEKFSYLESYLLRFVHHYIHAIDYICMVVGARVLRGAAINRDGWREVIERELARYAKLRQHHEVAWLLWLAIVAKLEISKSIVETVIKTENAHLSAMVVVAAKMGYIAPVSMEFPDGLDMTSDQWLLFHEAKLAGMVGGRSLENDELTLHSDLLKDQCSFIDFSIGEEQLRSGVPAIDGLRFGYDIEDELANTEHLGPQRGIFVPSSQDF
jgi:hypothetical protein